MSGRAGNGPGLLVEVAGAALLGGVLAVVALAIRRDISDRGMLAAVVVAGVVLSVLAAARLAPGDRRPAEPPVARPVAGDHTFSWHRATSAPAVPGNGTVPAASPVPAPRWRPPAAPHARVADPGTPAVEPDASPVSVAVPVKGGEWWQLAPDGERTPGRPAAAGRDPASSARVTAVDRAGSTATTRVVQCPRCGDFAVDLGHEQQGFAFRCRRCGNQWQWWPGTAWPVSVVRPRLGRRQPSGPGARPS
jgi:hypothetical protein